MSYNTKKREELYTHLAAEFFNRESNRLSLITVTRSILSADSKKSIILLTVYPEEKEKDVLEFARRKGKEFKDFVKKNSRIGTVPFFDFEIDEGEKNRQRVDRLV